MNPQITPLHESLLFNPQKLEFSHSGIQCPPQLQPFSARHGTFVTGTIRPVLQDAHVQLVLKGVVVGQVTSSATGTFSFGPYYDIDTDVDIIIEKQGYEFVISKIDGENISFSVVCLKLVRMEVIVSMNKEDKSGVLIALAGSRHKHRSNAQTDANGVVSFWKLPADSYYIKPMLKEYNFDPPFVQIEVDGTLDERVQFEAKRTGFSVFGNVTSLNRQVRSGESFLAVPFMDVPAL